MRKEMIKSLAVFILSTLVGIAYRMGGSGNYPRWTRPVGVGVGILITLFLLFGWHWSILISAGASAGLSTTYFKKKGTDAKWWNWALVGAALSLALLPWAIMTHHLVGFGLRTLALVPAITLWSEFNGNAVREEFGRGFLIIITLFLLGIGS